MDLQSIFYILAIAFMISWFFVLTGIIVGGWIIFKKLKKLQEQAVEKASVITNMGKIELAGMIFGAVSTFVANKLRDIFRGK